MTTLYILSAFVGGMCIWPLYRLFNPWRCKCGKVHWSTHRMMEHIEMKHVHEVSIDDYIPHEHQEFYRVRHVHEVSKI